MDSVCFETTHWKCWFALQEQNQKLKNDASSAVVMLGCCSPISFVTGVILLCVYFNKINGISYLNGSGRFRLHNPYFALKKVQSEAASSEFVLDCCWAFFSTGACSPSETVEYREKAVLNCWLNLSKVQQTNGLNWACISGRHLNSCSFFPLK